jgi:hypothetical protein
MAPTKPTGPAGKTETAPLNPDPTPGTGAGPQSQTPERDEPVSWVYKLNKEALTAMLSGLGLEATGTVEELRRRWTKFLRDRAAETVVPTEEPATSAAKKKKKRCPGAHIFNKNSVKLDAALPVLLIHFRISYYNLFNSYNLGLN